MLDITLMVDHRQQVDHTKLVVILPTMVLKVPSVKVLMLILVHLVVAVDTTVVVPSIQLVEVVDHLMLQDMQDVIQLIQHTKVD